jgi:ABC-2 type transport system permease protein
MTILITAGGLLFGVKWGSGVAVAALTMALVAAATGWGAVLAAYSRTSSQADQLGTMIALFFGVLAGNFVPRPALPSWMRTVGYVTPNAWGLEGFSSLTAGGGMSDVLVPIVVLLVMAAILFAAATVAFRRQFA